MAEQVGDEADNQVRGEAAEVTALLAALASAGGAVPAGRLATQARRAVAAAASAGLVTVRRGGALVALTADGHHAAEAAQDLAQGVAQDVAEDAAGGDGAHVAGDTPPDGARGGLEAADAVAWGDSPQRPQRIVYLDTENVVRPSPKPPTYLERITYQIGGVRAGADRHWVDADPTLSVYVAADPGALDPDELRDDHRRRYLDTAVHPADALDALVAWLAGADVVVAHNGDEVDFPALQRLWARVWATRRPDDPAPELWPDGRTIDSLYLTHAVWPHAASHALDNLTAERTDLRPAAADSMESEDAQRGGTAGGGTAQPIVAHDALDDSRALAAVVQAAADHTAGNGTAGRAAGGGWAPELAALLAAVTQHSRPWQLLAALGGAAAPAQRLDAATVRTAVAALVGDPHRPPTRPGATVTIDDLRGDDGHVDVAALADALTDNPEVRPAQAAATATLHRYARDGGGLLEAPTGTGKTLAMLAAALDWLAADASNRVVVATFTKALQRQMAGTIDALAELLGRVDADLVKGQANRLSLRGLVVAVTDLATGRRGSPTDPRFADLVAYLLVRLADTPRSTLDRWEARSVDAVDLPAALDRHCGPRYHRWRARLSQATAGEYDAGSSTFGHAARSVRDSLGGAKLIVANHALLLANLEHFPAPERTLLLVDEAHLLESAATDALAAVVDYDDVDDLTAQLVAHLDDLAGLIDDPPGTDADAVDDQGRPVAATARVDAAATAARRLAGVLADGTVARAALGMFDRHAAKDPLAGDVARTVVVSSPDDPTATGKARIVFVRALRLLGMRVRSALETYGRLPRVTDRTVSDRHDTLGARLYDLQVQLRRVTYDAADHLELPLRSDTRDTPPAGNDAPSEATTTDADTGAPTSDADTVASASDPAAAPAQLELDGVARGDDGGGQGDEKHEDGDDADDEDGDGGDDDQARERIAANRVVWAAETATFDPERYAASQRYPFAVTTSPIELSAEPDYADIATNFAAICYLSATLTVPDPAAGDAAQPGPDGVAADTPASAWRFIRDRLALPDDLPAVAYPSPFDYRGQARLVAFSDFPSWTEEAPLAAATVAHQLLAYHTAMASATGVHDRNGALVVTTSRAAAGAIAAQYGRRRAATPSRAELHVAEVVGNHGVTDGLLRAGGTGVGTKGLWQGTDIDDPDRLALVWINKLPFAPFADPVIAHRKARVAARAEADGHPDPDDVALRRYYLPLAAIELRQAVGRLIRTTRHRGAIIISDRKLAGADRLRRTYRDIFLGALDPGLLAADPADDSDVAGGNVVTMADGWATIWRHLADHGVIDAATVQQLTTADALRAHTLTPRLRAIRDAELTGDQAARLRDAAPRPAAAIVDADTGEVIVDDRRAAELAARAGALGDTLVDRASQIIGWLGDADQPRALRPHQEAVLRHIAAGDDVLAVLPTGYGKSYTFQLPALVLPGVTVVVSPLVALMTDQALELNRSIGGAVRALVGPMRESVSRRGKAEALAQLAGTADHGIKLIYLSPERLAHAQVAAALRQGVANGTVRAIALDEAHTFATWGEDFRPSFRRVETLLAELKRLGDVQITAVTATATKTVTDHLRTRAFGGATAVEVAANPIRAELAIWRRALSRADGRRPRHATLIAKLVAARMAARDGHTIVYCLTVADVERLAGMLRRHHGADAVLTYHGRMSSNDKAHVADRFRDAPHAGEDGFAPLVVVATAAFGLGINRPDIRAVIVASPPTDLAGLYQQLGRAGRDGQPAAAIAIASPQSLRITEWMATADDDAPLVAAARFVATTPGPVDLDDAAADLAAEVTDNPDKLEAVTDAVRVALTRVIADLADPTTTPASTRGDGDGAPAVHDAGDLPARVTIRRGYVPCPDPAITGILDAWLEAAADDELDLRTAAAVAAGCAPPTADSPLDAEMVDTAAAATSGRPAYAWALASLAYTLGWLDVSQRTRDGTFTWLADYVHVDVHGRPAAAATITAADAVARVLGRVDTRRAALLDEVAALRDFHDSEQCAQVDLADYFSKPAPDGVCTAAASRCSYHWEAGGHPDRPDLYEALVSHDLQPDTATADTAAKRQRLDADLTGLAHRHRRLLWAPEVRAALRGDPTYFAGQNRRAGRVGTRLRRDRAYASWLGLREADFDAAVERLAADGVLLVDGWRLSHARHAGVWETATASDAEARSRP